MLKEKFLLSASGDKTIKMWQISSGEQVKEFLGHTGPVKALTILPNDCIASSSGDRTIRLWDSSTGHFVRSITGFSSEVKCLQCLSSKSITAHTIKI